MSTHAAYIAGAFGMTFLAIALELLWLARRSRQRLSLANHQADHQPDHLDDAP